MGKKYEKRYYRHFAHPDIHAFDMQHEEWIFDPVWAKPMLKTIHSYMQD